MKNSDSSVYLKLTASDCIIICQYKGDTLIFGTNGLVVIKIKKFMSSKVETKDMREVDMIIGI